MWTNHKIDYVLKIKKTFFVEDDKLMIKNLSRKTETINRLILQRTAS